MQKWIFKLENEHVAQASHNMLSGDMDFKMDGKTIHTGTLRKGKDLILPFLVEDKKGELKVYYSKSLIGGFELVIYELTVDGAKIPASH